MFAGRVRAAIAHHPYHLLLPFTLVWLIKPFYQGTRLDWAALAIACPTFLGLYALAHVTRRPVAAGGLAGMSVLGAIYVPFNPEASGIFAFVAAIFATRSQKIGQLRWYLFGINLLLLAEARIFHLSLWTWVGGGSGAVLVSYNVLLYARERAANLQLRSAQDEIVRLAKLAERDRITRDLHDVLGHTLSLISMKSELAQKRFESDPQASLLETRQIEDLSRQALARVREVIHGYATASFAEEVDRITAALRSAGLIVECKLEDAVMTSMQEAVFAMILQEAATNIIRHAGAHCCRIEVQVDLEAVYLFVSDDGQGSLRYEGFGLRGMQERLRLLGGSLLVRADHGTHVQASLPR